MAMYAVIQLGDGDTPEEMGAKLQELDKSAYSHYASRGIFFLRYGGTAEQLAEKVGFGNSADAEVGIVITMGQNYGFAKKDLWTWMSMS